MASDGVEVQLLLEPISPVIYNHLKKEQRYDTFFETESVIYEIAARTNASCIGTFNPYKAKLEVTDFYDAYHVKPEILAILISPYTAVS